MKSEKNSEYWMYFPSTCAKSSKNFDYLLHKCLSYVQDLSQVWILRITMLQEGIIILSCLLQSNK